MGSSALDQAARAQGFRDFATYQAYQAQQQAMRTAPPAAQPAQPVQPQEPPRNWFQQLIEDYTPLGGAMRKVRKAL